MKGKISLLTRKIFATVIAVAMSIPPTAFANANEPVVYTEKSSIMGIKENKEELPRIENTDKTKLSKDLGSYNLEIKANLDPSLTKINYTIKARRKEKLAEDKEGKLSLSLTKAPSSNLNDLQLISANTENQTNEPDFKAEGLPSLVITSKAKDEIIYELSADVNKAKDQRSYKLILGLAEEEAKSEVLAYNLKVEKGLSLKDGQEVETVELVNEDDESPLIKGEYKKEGILGGLFASQDSITWEAFILNEEENQEITYDFNLDQNQDPTNSQIAIDYYEQTDKGFEIKREFSQTIDFAKKIKFEIPKGHLAKLTLKTKVSKKNTKVKSYSLNNGVVKNPIYIEGNEEEKSNDDEEPAQKDENKKYQKDHTDQGAVEVKPSETKPEPKPEPKPEAKPEAKPQGKDSQTQIIATDSSGKEIKIEEKYQPIEENKKPQISALILNRDSLTARLKAENKLTSRLETAIADLADILNSYNEEKITDQDLKDFTKSLAERNQIAKADLKAYLEAILSGLNKQTNKAANINYDEIITYAYTERKEEKPQDKKPEAKKTEGQKAEEKPAPKNKSQEKPSEKNEEPKANQEEKPLQNEKSEAVKTFDKDLQNLKEEAKKEPAKKSGIFEGLKSLLGQTDLQKADRELKKALADKKNTLEDIQKLLDSFKTKYKLSKADQAKLMDDNGKAIKALIEKHADKDFAPQMFLAQENGSNNLNLDGKKFVVSTIFQTSNKEGEIQHYQYFDIHLDEKLTVKDPSSLQDLKYKGSKVAKPTYDKEKNTIRYELIGNIADNISVPVNIPVDYNTKKIKLDSGGTFTVTNKVSGMGINSPPRDLIPQKIDKNGNLAGSIIEPGRDEVIEMIQPDDANYKVTVDGVANPVVENGELIGFDWKFLIGSNRDLSTLNFNLNFTTVEGSGLGQIERVKINGQEAGDKIDNNSIKGKFGIVDSIHHKQQEYARELTYTFHTKVTNKQESYMLDLSSMVNGKYGAKRINANQAYTRNQVADETPTRVGMNNRTTILGKFADNAHAQWTVTDMVCTGDGQTKLPLETRKPAGNQQFNTGKMAVYYINNEGRMAVKHEVVDFTTMPDKGTNPPTDQEVGTIAVYKYDTNLTGGGAYSLGGVSISKDEDLRVGQEWNLDTGAKMPAQIIKAVDANKNPDEDGYVLATKNLDASTDAKAARDFTIPNVKVWEIDGEGNARRVQPRLVQDLPKTLIDSSGQKYRYLENYNYYNENKREYILQNIATKQIDKKYASFTLLKTDNKGKPLAGAKFKMLNGAEVITDDKGKAEFSNIAPGSYTLVETKAPKGYKINTDSPIVKIDNDGRVSVSGGGASVQGGLAPTASIEHDPYKDYMNAMHFGKVQSDGSVVSYIYLKALGNRTGDYTNRDTRVNINTNLSGLDIKVYDVEPGNRIEVRRRMNAQDLGAHSLNDVLNVPSDYPIKGNLNGGASNYTIRFPYQRFGERNADWGFLIEIKGKKTNGKAPSVSYDWITDNDPDQAKLTNNVIWINDPNIGAKPLVTVPNEPFQIRPIEITKVKRNKTILTGSHFVLKDENGDPIATTTSDNNGKVKFGEHPEGKYTIEEVEAPEGYIKSDVVFDVIIDDSKQVTYKPRFKNKDEAPINGEDYILVDKEEAQASANAQAIHVDQSLTINEGNSGELGTIKDVWEAYRLESLKYTATIKLKDSSPGKRFSIQFDPNLDFTQYFGRFPQLNLGGRNVADPYFDYTTNKLTYVFNENSINGEADVKLELKGIIPSKFFAQNDGDYTFHITVAPGEKNVTGTQNLDKTIKADYGRYDSDRGFKEPTQSYYFRDVYKAEDGQWYVKALAYYNPQHYNGARPKELKFNWMSTNYQGGTLGAQFFEWKGNGQKPAFSLHEVKVYQTIPDMYQLGDKKINRNLPLSFGVRPERDPAKYNLLYERHLDPHEHIIDDRQGPITVNYNPERIQSYGAVKDNSPLRVGVPGIDNKTRYGYIIEQTFKVDDMYRFQNYWRVFTMSNNKFHSSFATRSNYNSSSGEQSGGELPKYYSQEAAIINNEYVPGSFTITKIDDTDRTIKLKGAIFSLQDENKNKFYRTSDDNGLVEFTKLKPGIYTLREEKSPKDYIKSERKWRVNVSIDGAISIIPIGLGPEGDTISGKNINLEVTNKPEAVDFVVYKKDDADKPLPGAIFTITKKGESQAYTTGVSDIKGTVNFTRQLEKGTYILEETKAPKGYNKLDQKWVIEVVSGFQPKVYKYIDGPKVETNPEVNKSLLGEDGTRWVDVAKRPIDNWNPGDNRRTGYVNNSPTPFVMGTRIIAINKAKKYAIQRYIINPESNSVILQKGVIHREKPNYNNMTWYKGDEEIKIFTLDKAVDDRVDNIRLENYKLEDITNQVPRSRVVVSGTDRMQLDFGNKTYTKPIVIDVKIPYQTNNAGVGTGMDLLRNNTFYWKSDYYSTIQNIVEGDLVKTSGQANNIKGALVSEGYLDVANTKKKFGFTFKKTAENKTDAVSGATFKLQGPKINDQDLGSDKWEHSNDKGEVSFKDLLPGVYKLTETGAAQGYELANTDWTVTILEDGRIYMRDNNLSDTVPDNDPDKKWQKVTDVNTANNNRYRPSVGIAGGNAYITDVNKAAKRFRQTFIVNTNRDDKKNYLDQVSMEIHSYPEDWDITSQNTTILGLYEVDRASTVGSLIKKVPISFTTSSVTRKGKKRLVIHPKTEANKTLALEIETKMPNSGAFGAGMNFINYRPYFKETYDSWIAERYNDENSPSLSAPPSSTTGKNAKLIVDGKDKSPQARSVLYTNDDQDLPTPLASYLNKSLEMRSVGNDLTNFTRIAPLNLLASREDRAASMLRASSDLGEINPYPVDAPNANIEVSARAVNLDRGTRDINVKITPKTRDTGKKTSHWILLVDRSVDWSNGLDLDNNINKFITDLRAKADTPGAEVYLSIIEYCGGNGGNKVLLTKKNIKELDGARDTSYTMTTLSSAGNGQYNLNEQPVSIKDYLKYVGVSDRDRTNKDGATLLKTFVDANINNLTSDSYDKKYVINFANFNAETAVRNKDNPNKFYQFESMWAFHTKGYTRVYTHVDQENASYGDNSTGNAFRTYTRGNSDRRSFDLTNSYVVRNRGYKKARDYAPYVQKQVLDELLNDSSNFQGQGPAESALKNASVDISLNPGIRLNSYIIKKNASVIEQSPNIVINDYIKKDNISLGINETYEISYQVELDQGYENGKDYKIHKVMGYKPEPNSQPINLDNNNLLTRREAETTYNVVMNTMYGGKVTSEKKKYKAGEIVKLTITPEPGNELAELYYTDPVTSEDIAITNNQFKMPAGDVGIKATFRKKQGTTNTKPVNIADGIEHGRVSVNPTSQEPGKPVTVTATPEDGYELENIRVVNSNGRDVDLNGHTFIMPSLPVTVIATFKPKQTQPAGKYKISLFYKKDEGEVSLDRDTANPNDKVTFTIKPKDGYVFDNAVVGGFGGFIDTTDEGNGKKSFIMPDENVSVSVTFQSTHIQTYKITPTQPQKGGVIKADPQSAKPGDIVRLSVNLSDGYALKEFIVTSESGATVTVKNNTFEMPASNVKVSAVLVEIPKTDPGSEGDNYKPQAGDVLIWDGKSEKQKDVKITNKKDGIVPRVIKKDALGNNIEGAIFTVKKMTSDTYDTIDGTFKPLTGTSDRDGIVHFYNDIGKEVKLQTGYYLLTEDKAPVGYKKIVADWKVEIKEDGGRMYSEYQGPQDTPTSLLNSDKANAGKSADNLAIKYKSRLTFINPETKTYVQRIFIDTRSMSQDVVNVQITPKHKREEIDRAGLPPVTIKEGVKTAYRTTYELTNPESNKDIQNNDIDTIIRTYDLSIPDMKMVNTARWRPFDWGFDEDQLNLGKGVYIIDIEGYYDQSIIDGMATNEVMINNDYNFVDEQNREVKDPVLKKPYKKSETEMPKADYGKIELHVDFYTGARHFLQLKRQSGGSFEYENIARGSYQGGIAEVAKMVAKIWPAKKETWPFEKPSGQKYQNYVSKQVKIDDQTYIGGKIEPAVENVQPNYHADTSVDLSPLYNSSGNKEIPKEGLTVINDQESFNITFSKHGRDEENWADNGKEVTVNRLEGAIFKLQQQAPGDIYEDMPGKTIASAFNGYFGFRNLKPGRYRLMEVQAPKGYQPIKDPILYMTISYKGKIINNQTGEITPGRGVITLEYNENAKGIIKYSPEKSTTLEDGKLVDYVTSATAKNMGKIINEKPGKGKISITKVDERNQPLNGAEFKLSRLEIAKDEKTGNEKLTKTTVKTGTSQEMTITEGQGQNQTTKTEQGKIVFDKLPIGRYILEETKPAQGYKNRGQVWHFIVGGDGLDSFANDNSSGGVDLSDKIKLADSYLNILKKNGDINADSTTIKPHQGEHLQFTNKFKVDKGVAVNAGDYFTVKLSDNIDLNGVKEGEEDKLDLIADGIGTMAKAKYDRANATITYTFTEYAKQYDIEEFSNTLSAYITSAKVKNSGKQSVGLGIGSDTSKQKTVSVVYDLQTKVATDDKNTINLASKITKFNTKNGQFDHYFYVNRLRQEDDEDLTFRYSANVDISGLKFEYYQLEDNAYTNIATSMPESFGVNLKDANISYLDSTTIGDINANMIGQSAIGRLPSNKSMIIKVSGKANTKDLEYFKATSELFGANHKLPYIGKWDEIYLDKQKASPSSDIHLTATNVKNKITFKKIGDFGQILTGAKFKLKKKTANTWTDQGAEKEVNEDGLISYEDLEAGQYMLEETKAPDGYSKIEGSAAEFDVGEDGKITRQIDKPKEIKPTREEHTQSSMLGTLSSGLSALREAVTGKESEKITEEIGDLPINIVNNKEIVFRKVDAENDHEYLEGAEFEVWYKEKIDDTYKPYTTKNADQKESIMKAKSGKDGIFKLSLRKQGYYALKETKAPKDYAKLPGYIKEFSMIDGKMKVLEKNPLKATFTKGKNGKLTSEIVKISKDKKQFTQRIIINPNHDSWKFDSDTQIRVIPKGWKIYPTVGNEAKIKVAALGKNESIKSLTKMSFREISNYNTINASTNKNYKINDLLNDTTSGQYVTTDKTIVVDITGELDDINKPVDLAINLVFDLQYLDQISYNLDLSKISKENKSYLDIDTQGPIKVENTKVELPDTSGTNAWIGYTIGGLLVMIAAAYVYHKKQVSLASGRQN